MKLFILFILCSFSVFSQTSIRKKALLIGIGKYPRESKWDTLGGELDVNLMKQTLINQDFHQGNISTLVDNEATKNQIERAFNKLILSAQEKDIVILFFSGHGIQIPDTNGDEKDDKLDEAIVPYDSKSKNDKNTIIIDDQLGEWIRKLREKVKAQGHIILILNSCHSGTGSKGNETQNEDYQVKKYDFIDKVNVSGNLGKFVAFEASNSKLSTQVITTPDKKKIGALPYAVAVAFENIKKNTNYATFFHEVENIIYIKGNHQVPFCEEDMDSFKEKVLDGEIIEQTFTYKLASYFNKRVKILSGYLENIYPGAKFNFLGNTKKGDDDSQTIIARGVVIETNAFESIIEIKEGNLPNDLSKVVGVQTEQAFGSFKTAVQFKAFKDKSLQKSLEEAIAGKNTISITNDTPDLELSERKDSIIIRSLPTSFFHWKIKKEGEFRKEVINKIIDFGRAKIIAGLQVDNADYSAEISLKHSINKEENEKWIPTFYSDTTQNSLVFNTAQQSWFTIKNTGKETFYFTLIDIQPDGILNITFPNEEKGWDRDCVELESGKEKGFPIGRPTKPFGNEMYKVILSPSYEDFSFLTWQDKTKLDENKKGDDSPLISLFKDLSDGTMQRTKGNLPFVGGTTELIFRIVPARE